MNAKPTPKSVKAVQIRCSEEHVAKLEPTENLNNNVSQHLSIKHQIGNKCEQLLIEMAMLEMQTKVRKVTAKLSTVVKGTRRNET